MIGTKSDLLKRDADLVARHHELRQKAREFSRVINGLGEDARAPYFEVSALTGENVSRAFEFVFDALDPESRAKQDVGLLSSKSRKGDSCKGDSSRETSLEMSTDVDSAEKGNKRPSQPQIIRLDKGDKRLKKKCSSSCAKA